MKSGWLLLAVAAMTVVAGCASPFAAPGASVGGGTPPTSATSPPDVPYALPVTLRATPAAPVVGERVAFVAEAPGAVGFSWSFGDGTFAETREASHTYQAAGRYTVTAVAKAANGTRGSAERVLIVAAGAAPPPATNATPPPPARPALRQFLPGVMPIDVVGTEPTLSVGANGIVAVSLSSFARVPSELPPVAHSVAPIVLVARSADGIAFASLPAPAGESHAPALAGAVHQRADGATVLVQTHGPAASATRWTAAAAADGSAPVPGLASIDAPALAASADLLHARVLDAQFNGWFSESNDGGKTWLPVQGLPLQSSCAPGDLVALSASQLLTLVCSGDGALRLARSSDGGKTWTNATVADARDPIGPPALAARADGAVFVAYVAANASKGSELRLLQSRDGGATWPSAVALSGPGPAARPAIAVAPTGDRAVVAWYESETPGAPVAASQGAWSIRFTEIVDGVALSSARVAPEAAHTGPACIEASLCDNARLRLGAIDVAVGPDGRAWVAWTDSVRIVGSTRVIVAHQ
ncbi:MAG TPA: PKD domain-containing protein [Candidatus Thermoplasmatota archaeon]|nr:PKD domain-containing protein [Candidatus Thermoplasmatota archaeon]